MKVLSLFDGISCGMIALERAGLKVDTYYASEIEVESIKISQRNYPQIIQLGDVTRWREWDIPWGEIDLLIGGSPCQGFSIAGKKLSFDDVRSKLFFDYVEILRHIQAINPNVMFLLENVKMKQEWLDIISDYLKVLPIEINSALVSAQNRPRVYWTNITNELELPTNKHIYLKDIIEHNVGFVYIDEQKTKNRTFKKNYMQYDINGTGHGSQDQRAYYLEGKCGCLDTGCGSKVKLLCEDGRVRKFTKRELERLQTLPDGYTDGALASKATQAIGNGWTVDVISHIFNHLKTCND